eukprot:14900449-Alexandrium_andersonii.AAC.1
MRTLRANAAASLQVWVAGRCVTSCIALGAGLDSDPMVAVTMSVIRNWMDVWISAESQAGMIRAWCK